MLPLVLAEFLDDEKILIQFSAIYILATSGLYLFTYLWNRIKLKAPTPLVSALVMIGYFIWLPFLILTAAGLVFHPSLGIIAAYGFWIFISSTAIFVYFLYEFIHPGQQ